MPEFVNLLERAWPIAVAGAAVAMVVTWQRRIMAKQRKATAALLESDERFRAFVDNSPMVAYIKDAQDRLVWMNAAFMKIAPGMKAGDTWDRLRGTGAAEEQMRQSEQAVLRGERSEYVAQVADKDGTIRHWLVLRFPVRHKGELLIGCQALDVTASRQAELKLRESEERFRAFMDHSPMIGSLKDAEGRYLWLSAAFDTVNPGLRERWMGRKSSELLPPGPAADIEANDRETLERGASVQEIRSVPAGDGTTRHWLSFKFRMDMKEGPLVGGMSLDVTEKVEAELKLKAYSQDLERSNRELQDFASVAAHDLQEPLRKIRAFSDLLASELGGGLSGEAREYLNRMQASAGRMQALIEDLLTYSRVGTRGGDFGKVDLAAVLRDVRADLELAIQRSGAVIEADELPPIEADPVQMRQLFQNLLANAIKFSKPGQAPRVRVASALKAHELELRFEDQGIGFEPKYADRIFTIFQRLHGRGEYEGNGVGLAVCRKIAERHGGSIRAQGGPGTGAVFEVVLPRKQAKGTK